MEENNQVMFILKSDEVLGQLTMILQTISDSLARMKCRNDRGRERGRGFILSTTERTTVEELLEKMKSRNVFVGWEAG
ncbi:uncharacterized [Tachysurus ichikawai]